MRAASGLIPSTGPVRFLDQHGKGLAAVYDAIFGRDPDAFFQIRHQFVTLFPSVIKLGWLNVSATEKAMEITLKDGTRVPSEHMSEGMLYYLAFAALPHLGDVDVVCIEEPENGLHPARIREVMRVLRDLSQRTQVLLATHSPLVVNELEPDEITVVTRTPERGTQGVLLRDTADFASRARVYAPGELWLSYANGEDERALIQGGPAE